MRRIAIVLAVALSLPAFAGGRGREALDSAATIAEEMIVDLDGMTTSVPTMDSMGGSPCDAIGSDFCAASCENKTAHSTWIVVSSSCETTENPMQFRCLCVWIVPGPYLPPCYWNCIGRQPRSGIGLY